jgi:hypothetical protein
MKTAAGDHIDSENPLLTFYFRIVAKIHQLKLLAARPTPKPEGSQRGIRTP